jgi:hypothetical protein
MDHPVLLPVVTDRLSFILPWCAHCTPEEQDQKLKKIKQRIQEEIDQGTCVRAFPSRSRYKERFQVVLNQFTNSHALVQIGALNPSQQHGGIHVSINPAKLSKDEIRQFHEVMHRIVGPSYRDLMSRARLSRADFAIDIQNVNLDDLLVDYLHSQRHTVFGKRLSRTGIVEGYNYGSVSSDYLHVVYDKKIERVHAAALNLMKNGAASDELKHNAVRRLDATRKAPETVRVEVRCMKLRGCLPFELLSLPNRFTRFKFGDLRQHSAYKLSKFDRHALIAMCRHDGTKAALALYARERPDVQARKFWNSIQADWWNPASAWTSACMSLRESGIFPPEAFDQPADDMDVRPTRKKA